MPSYEELFQSFVGKDKIQPIRVEEHNDTFTLVYKEKGKIQRVNCEDRDVLETILIHFGGKNPETCKAPSEFLRMKKNDCWQSEHLNELGHRITKIQLSGRRTLRSKKIPIYMPPDTGNPGIILSKRKNKDFIRLRLNDDEKVNFTRSFKEPSEFDNMTDFIFSDEALKDLNWSVDELCTQSRETGQQCKWVRTKAGDGTQRMVLELQELDGVHYEKCVRQDLFNAAGDMFDAPCKVVKLKKKSALPTKKICLFAAEDGTVNIKEYNDRKSP